MNYIETCTKIAVFLWRSSNYRPLTSVLHVRPGWIIYQNMRETWEKKVMKFECEIPIGLDARRKKWRGGHKGPPPPPNGIRVKLWTKVRLTIWWLNHAKYTYRFNVIDMIDLFGGLRTIRKIIQNKLFKKIKVIQSKSLLLDDMPS